MLSTAALYGATNSYQARAEIDPFEQPIYYGPANSPNFCMADAYVRNDGKGVKDILGEELNCTSNDVEITEVIPKAIILPGGEESTDLTCTEGQPFQLKADIRVRANSAERWDVTFNVPRKEDINPKAIYQDSEACSIIVPVPVGTQPFDQSVLVAQQLDGDVCGDIDKSVLTNDEYTLEDAVFTIICEDGGADGETFDGQADFNYCAGWDNQSSGLCEVQGPYPGQEPNTSAKCKCDNFNIPVFLTPNPPTVTKSVTPLYSNETSGTFRYTLTITKSNGGDVEITSLEDVYYSTTDNTISKVFDLTAGTDNDGQNLYLLDSEGALNTCNDLSFPYTLTDTSPTLSCSFSVQILDGDLPDDSLPTNENSGINPKEVYNDFIRFSATDAEGRGIDVGNGSCDPTDAVPDDDSNCSSVVAVEIRNVDPDVSITKTPESGPGLRNVGGAWFVDDQGEITYEITVTNDSSVDPVWIIELIDDNGTPLNLADDIDLLSDSSSSPACNTAPDDPTSDTPLGLNDSFTCSYTVNVSVDDGVTYTNKVNVIVNDNEARAAAADDTASVTRAEPMITLLKDVAVWVDSTTPLPALGDPAFVQAVNVDEPGDRVVYQFTITNANNVTEEDIYVTSLIDDVLFGSPRATSGPQRTDECDFTTPVVVEYGTPYQCTLVADVTGNGSDDPDTGYDDTFLLNTAQVTAKRDPTDGDEDPTYSNEDTAQVNFDDVAPQFETNFGFHANVFVKLTNSSDFEDITINKVSIRGINIPEDSQGDVTVGTLFKIFDDSATGIGSVLDTAFGQLLDGYCNVGETIAAGDTYACFVRVQIFDAFNIFDTFSASGNDDGVVIEVVDDDGSLRAAEVEVTFVTEDVIQP
jgi:hypothetical protein